MFAPTQGAVVRSHSKLHRHCCARRKRVKPVRRRAVKTSGVELRSNLTDLLLRSWARG